MNLRGGNNCIEYYKISTLIKFTVLCVKITRLLAFLFDGGFKTNSHNITHTEKMSASSTTNEPVKHFVSYNEVHQIIQSSSSSILNDFKPDMILAIAGGGLLPARILRTFLQVPIKSVSLELYNDATKTMNDSVKMTQWIQLEDIRDKVVLIVDEVDDTRTTLHYCVSQIKEMRPKKLGVFVVHNKLKEKRAGKEWCQGLQKYNSTEDALLDFYYSGEDIEDKWICYPWDAYNITEHTVKANEKKMVSH